MNHQRWVIHKFGGTSVANAERYSAVAKIIQTFSPTEKRAIVVSAMSKVTDRLFATIKLCEEQNLAYKQSLDLIINDHKKCVEDLLNQEQATPLATIFDNDKIFLLEILKGIWHTRHCPQATAELISGYGEIWSAQILAQALRKEGLHADWLDARKVLVVEPKSHTVSVKWNDSQSKMQDWLRDNSNDIVVITGYVATTDQGVATTLKRNGSDYSASIFGKILNAKAISIWTDVNGVMSADPRLVPDAIVLSHMSYAEASELAFFGAKVVHPDTMAPAFQMKIPIWIKNTFNPVYPGTLISDATTTKHPVKGFATIDQMSLINVEGTGMVGIPGVSERLFRALKDVEVSVVMISQASSEQSICFAVPTSQASKAQRAAQHTFATEIERKEIHQISKLDNCSVLAMVGDGMANQPGIAGQLFMALGHARVNCLAIAQGSSERNISVVVPQEHITRAVRAAHSAFFLSHQTLSVGIIGTGVVGATLLEQLSTQSETLRKERGIDIRIRAIANSKFMLHNDVGLKLENWSEQLNASSQKSNLEKISQHICESHYPHNVIVDVTASEETTKNYHAWLNMGLHIITANKRAGSGDLNLYKDLHKQARKSHHYFLYETTVGAGLPIIRTIKDLVQTGDEILEIEGVMSGTLSYLFNSYNDESPFSEVLMTAKQKGFTEPDPRDDLSGLDVARKLVILAREAGLDCNLANVKVESLVPSHTTQYSVDDFFKNLTSLDQHIRELYKAACSENKILRYIGRVGINAPPEVKLIALPNTHPFARLNGTDNIFLIRTKRYNQQPMVIQGPGAGPQVTAAGLFAELIRLADHLGAPQ